MTGESRDLLLRAIERFESGSTDLADEARLAGELRLAAKRHAEVLRRSSEIILNDRRVYRQWSGALWGYL